MKTGQVGRGFGVIYGIAATVKTDVYQEKAMRKISNFAEVAMGNELDKFAAKHPYSPVRKTKTIEHVYEPRMNALKEGRLFKVITLGHGKNTRISWDLLQSREEILTPKERAKRKEIKWHRGYNKLNPHGIEYVFGQRAVYEEYGRSTYITPSYSSVLVVPFKYNKPAVNKRTYSFKKYSTKKHDRYDGNFLRAWLETAPVVSKQTARYLQQNFEDDLSRLKKSSRASKSRNQTYQIGFDNGIADAKMYMESDKWKDYVEGGY